MADWQPLDGGGIAGAAPVVPGALTPGAQNSENFSSSLASDKSPAGEALTKGLAGFSSGLAQQHHADFGALFGHGPAGAAPAAAPVSAGVAAPPPPAPVAVAPPPMIQAPQMQAMSDRRTKTAIAPADNSLSDFLAALGGRR